MNRFWLSNNHLRKKPIRDSLPTRGRLTTDSPLLPTAISVGRLAGHLRAAGGGLNRVCVDRISKPQRCKRLRYRVRRALGHLHLSCGETDDLIHAARRDSWPVDGLSGGGSLQRRAGGREPRLGPATGRPAAQGRQASDPPPGSSLLDPDASAVVTVDLCLVIVEPDTVVAWHRRGFRWMWRWKSRRRQFGATTHRQGNPRSRLRHSAFSGSSSSFGTIVGASFISASPTPPTDEGSNLSPFHAILELHRRLPNMHPSVHMRIPAEIPNHRRPLNLPDIPNPIAPQVLVLVESHVQVIEAVFLD